MHILCHPRLCLVISQVMLHLRSMTLCMMKPFYIL
uniref:Uncharacterized protein n=1 Tax=Anguilla anguilla TaxID=7936 RepID=A0A0E9WK12_ANGAN